MKKAVLTAISLFFWIYFIVSSVIFTPIIVLLWILTVIPDKNLRILHKFSCFWGAQYIWVIPLWKLRIHDRIKTERGKKYVMVSNHQSLADILVIYSLFRHFRWTSKTENFRLPFVGWVLMLNRSIRIYRGEADAWKKFEVQAVKALKDGNSIMIFPEGTRSRTGEPGRFREGAFQLAHNMKTDILPIVLDGTWKAVPKSGWVLTGYQEMVVKVLDPIPFSDFEQMTVPELTHFVHDLILKNLNQLRQLNK